MLKKEIIKAFKFFGISGIGWIMDITVYLILSVLFGINVGISNIISSFVAITFVFFVSTSKIFKKEKTKSLKLKYIIYIVYQILLIVLSSFVITTLKKWILLTNINFLVKFVNIICKIIVTPFTMILNYFVMRYIIERIEV